jgi:hypothetical protein
VPTMPATVTWWPELTLLDRCDRCNGDALVRVVFVTGSELYFCERHSRQHEPQLVQLDVVLYRSPRARR